MNKRITLALAWVILCSVQVSVPQAEGDVVELKKEAQNTFDGTERIQEHAVSSLFPHAGAGSPHYNPQAIRKIKKLYPTVKPNDRKISDEEIDKRIYVDDRIYYGLFNACNKSDPKYQDNLKRTRRMVRNLATSKPRLYQELIDTIDQSGEKLEVGWFDQDKENPGRFGYYMTGSNKVMHLRQSGVLGPIYEMLSFAHEAGGHYVIEKKLGTEKLGMTILEEELYARLISNGIDPLLHMSAVYYFLIAYELDPGQPWNFFPTPLFGGSYVFALNVRGHADPVSLLKERRQMKGANAKYKHAFLDSHLHWEKHFLNSHPNQANERTERLKIYHDDLKKTWENELKDYNEKLDLILGIISDHPKELKALKEFGGNEKYKKFVEKVRKMAKARYKTLSPGLKIKPKDAKWLKLFHERKIKSHGDYITGRATEKHLHAPGGVGADTHLKELHKEDLIGPYLH